MGSSIYLRGGDPDTPGGLSCGLINGSEIFFRVYFSSQDAEYDANPRLIFYSGAMWAEQTLVVDLPPTPSSIPSAIPTPRQTITPVPSLIPMRRPSVFPDPETTLYWDILYGDIEGSWTSMTEDEVAGYDSGGTIRMHFVVEVPGQYGSSSFFGSPTGPGGTDTGTFTWKFYSMSEDRIYDLRADLSNWANYLGTRESYRVELEKLLPTPSLTQTSMATPSTSMTPSPTPRYSATPTPPYSLTPTPVITPTPTPSPSSHGLRLVIAGNDYDGDGRADPAVWNDRTGKWYIDLSFSGVRESYCNETVGGVVNPDPVDPAIGPTPEILQGKNPPTEPNPIRSVAEVADLGSSPGQPPGLQSAGIFYFGRTNFQ